MVVAGNHYTRYLESSSLVLTALIPLLGVGKELRSPNCFLSLFSDADGPDIACSALKHYFNKTSILTEEEWMAFESVQSTK
jgi:hypothetical protein